MKNKPTLYDNFGRTIQASGLYTNPYRMPSATYKQRNYYPTDTHKAVNSYERSSLMTFSRELFSQLPNIGTAVLQKNTWAFLGGFKPRYKGTNKKWGERAEEWLMNDWFPICNVRGGNYPFVQSLYLDGISIDTDGDSLMVLVTGRDGFPLLQWIPSHRIGQRDNQKTVVTEGKYKGRKIIDGVILNDQLRPLAYRVLGDTAAEDVDLPAQSSQLGYSPEWHDQIRGIPSIGRVVADLIQIQDIDYYTLRAVKAGSTIPIVFHNETGTADSGNVLSYEDTNVTNNLDINPVINFEEVSGGEYTYIAASANGKVEIPNSERPSPNVEAFIERIEKRALAAIGWNFYLIDPAKVGGASVRLLIDQAKNSVRGRQAIGSRRAKLAINHALARAMELGFLPDNRNDNWYNWDFQFGPQMSVDSGNDRAADLNDMKYGVMSKSQYSAKAGKDYYDTIDEMETEENYLAEKALAYYNKYKEHGVTFQQALDRFNMRNSSGLAVPFETKEETNSKPE